MTMALKLGRHEPEITVSMGDFPTTYAYNGDGTLHTIAIVIDDNTFTKTYTYTVGVLTHESAWVKS
jgi:hypothetical protein